MWGRRDSNPHGRITSRLKGGRVCLIPPLPRVGGGRGRNPRPLTNLVLPASPGRRDLSLKFWFASTAAVPVLPGGARVTSARSPQCIAGGTVAVGAKSPATGAQSAETVAKA